MITLATTETLSAVAGTATAITYTIHGMELTSGVEAYKTLAQGQLAVSTGTLYTVPASTQTFIKSIHLANATGSDVSGIKFFSKGTAATNQITGSFTIPANGWAEYESNSWKFYNPLGQLLQSVVTNNASGGTPAIILGTAAAAGSSPTFLRDDDTILAFDVTTPANIAGTASVGTATVAARRDHVHTIGTGTVTRAMETPDGKGWSFIGSASNSTVTVGPIITAGSFREFMIFYQITGYNGGSPVGRFLCGPGTPSTTALTNSYSLSEGVTAPTTGAGASAIPGVPLAVTTTAIGRSGVIFVDGLTLAGIKTINIIGNEGTPSVATAPVLFRGASFFSDLSTNTALKQFQLTVYDTLIAVAPSAQTFNTGTYLIVWGRNTD